MAAEHGCKPPDVCRHLLALGLAAYRGEPIAASGVGRGRRARLPEIG
ncbi:MAG: hypothetical protein WBN89_00570 [Prochlorococcaceae cyanobacterium]